MSVNFKTTTGLLEIAGNGVAHWTGTREQYELDKDQIPDGTYVDITDDYTIPSDEGEIYDDTERVIGTWFGKPLYRKTFVVDRVDLSSKYAVIPTPLTNVKNIINHSIFLFNGGNNSWYNLPWIRFQTTDSIGYYIYINSNNDLIIGLSSNVTFYTDLRNVTITLEYTKVGD